MSNDFTSTINQIDSISATVETVQLAEITAVGIQGLAGPTGLTGPGVAIGGTIGQALTKLSGTNYDTTWTTITKSTVGLGNVDNESKATMFTSPTLTGTPLAPTAGPTTNTTQIATTEFVKTAVSNLINSAPAALDTLNELAAALGNDANFATTITNSLSLKAPLESPTFTGTVKSTNLTATTADLTLSAVSTGSVIFSTNNGIQAKVVDSAAASVNWVELSGGSGNVGISSNGSGSPTIAFKSKSAAAGAFSFGTANSFLNIQAQIAHTASAVNYVQVTGGATGIGNFPTISSQGSDANVNLRLSAKGSASIDFQIGGTTRASIDNSGTFRAGTAANGTAGFQVAVTGSQVNFFSTTGTITGLVPSLSALGSDTNISMALQPKGTGAIDLAAGSSGVNISNGGTVTAITRTAQGSGYTSIPSVAISAPTTAGGVQATATVGSMVNAAATVASGGTGYAVGNVLTVVGGTPTSISATLTVTAVSSGVITSVIPTNFGQYSVLPTNPVSTTGGTGSGATLNLTFAIGSNPSFNITNAGSGYIEQPTVTFSGGGGSGATAYASVGSGTTITTLASPLTLQTPSLNANNTTFQVRDDATIGASQTTFYMIGASSGLGRGALRSNKAFYIASGSSNNIVFLTNSGLVSEGSEQLRVLNTVSAVNYVQVTGAATSAAPIISAQGSDANIGLVVQSKGTTPLYLKTNGVAQTIIQSNSLDVTRFNAQTSAVNYFTNTATAAGTPPTISTQGTDTDIDFALNPKAAGVVVVKTDQGIDTKTATTTATTANQVIATFPAGYRSVKAVIQATDATGNKYHSTELLIVSNNTNTSEHTEYGSINIGGLCATYTVDYSSGIRILATPATANSTVFKIVATLIKV